MIGLKEAKTKFCVAAESDCLYPPEYFSFEPERDDSVYRYTNVYVYFHGRDGFWKKPWSEGSQLCGRKFWIEQLEKKLDGYPEWEPINGKRYLQSVFKTKNEFSWESENPVVTFKTRRGITFGTGYINGRIKSLPYWGRAKPLYEGLYT